MIEVRLHKDNLSPKRCCKIHGNAQCPNKINSGDYYVMSSHWGKEKKEITWLCAKCGLAVIQPLLEQAGLMWSQLNDTLTKLKAKKHGALQREGTDGAETTVIPSEQTSISNISTDAEDFSQYSKEEISKLLDN